MNRRFRKIWGLGLAIAVIVSCFTINIFAQTAATQDPLVQVLVNKGILTADDAKSLSGTPAEQHDRLVQLLKEKGVISTAEYNTLNKPASPAVKSVSTESNASLVPTVLTSTSYPQEKEKKEAPKPAAPTFVPAVAPVRVLQLEPAKPGGFVPDIKLTNKVGVKLYGYLKASAVYDTSSPGGNDFPLPGFLGDTPPNGSPEFHLKARNARFGANFEFPDVSDKVAITGKIEFDWEGNFTRVNNRNISSVRSSQPSLRLAWGRIDYRSSPDTSFYFLGGQDWTPFGSSILPNQIETTGLDIGFGSIYTRDMQLRVGMTHKFGSFTFGPDFAITYPGWGLVPSNLANQLAYGERQGADSQKPEVQGRLVFQFPVDHAKGVAPAQIIFSGMHANRTVEVIKGAYTAANGLTPAQIALVSAAFPTGLTQNASRYGWTAGFQIPTRFVTFVANYYRGSGLRWYFAGQIYPGFNNGSALTAPVGGFFTVPSIDDSSSLLFGLPSPTATAVVPAPIVEPRAQGGFAELEFPLSRIFNAEPGGRNAGWTMVLHYGYDGVFARDVRRANTNAITGVGSGGRGVGEVYFGNLQYKMNSYVTFAYEQSYYRTRAIAGPTGSLPLFQGVGQHDWHDLRSEFATIFTF